MCNIMILVNREHPLDPDYIPPELQEADFPFLAGSGDPKRLLCRPAALAGKELFDRCRMEGLSLYGISGYRSYECQSSLCLKKGNPADLYLAPPGCSEHQTGLALDVSCPAANFELEEKFSSTPEGIFLEKHAPFYGFILRYPKGKEKVTGYAWEPWHLRYVGRSLALCLSFMRLTLEEYLALSLPEE